EAAPGHGARQGAQAASQSGPRQERTLTMTQHILGLLWGLLGWKGAVVLAGAAGLGAFILLKTRSTVALAAAVLAGLRILWYAWPSGGGSSGGGTSGGSGGGYTDRHKKPPVTKTAKRSRSPWADMAGGPMGFMPGMGMQGGMPSPHPPGIPQPQMPKSPHG